MKWYRLLWGIGVMGIVSFCMPVLGSEFEKPTEVEVRTVTFEPIPQKDIEIVFIEPVEEAVLSDCPYTQEEIDLLARLVMAEGGILPMDGKQAIAQTVLNRVASDSFPDTISDVIYEVKHGVIQFSASPKLYVEEPTLECYYAVEGAIEYPDAYPTDMFWFRIDYPHNFAHFYTQIGNTFFNTEIDYLNMEVADDVLY